MRFLRTLFNIARSTHTEKTDIPQVTDFLKKSETFKKGAMKIHHKKESFKSNFWGSIDDLIKEEDNVKFIEDKSKKK
jgi:hypothetical protein